MVRTLRRDTHGRFHHIMNRAEGRQILLADRRGHRKFLSLFACAPSGPRDGAQDPMDGELVVSDREYAAMAGRAARTALDETFSR